MLTLENLDGLKLVRDENVANLRQTQAELEHAVTQGSQGWGVTEEHAVLLRVAFDLQTALKLASAAAGIEEHAREAYAALKGKQLELGRANARHLRMLDVSKAQSEEIANLNAVIGVKDDKIRGLEERFDDFVNEARVQAELTED